MSNSVNVCTLSHLISIPFLHWHNNQRDEQKGEKADWLIVIVLLGQPLTVLPLSTHSVELTMLSV